MSSRRSRSLILVALALAGFARAARANPVQEATLGVKTSVVRPEEENPFEFSVDYSGRANLNATEEPRSLSHALELSVSRDFGGHYTWTLGAGVEFMTMDGAIYRDTDREDYFSPRDPGLSVMRVFRTPDLRHSLVLIGAEDLLITDESRYLGYRSVTTLQGVHSWTFGGRFALKSAISTGYILNTFRFSPVSSERVPRGGINPDGFYGAGVGPLVTLAPGLKIGAQISMRGTHYLDGSNLYDFGNSYSLTYARGPWVLYARYLNKGWAERGETNLWFVDKYRRLAQAGVTYNF